MIRLLLLALAGCAVDLDANDPGPTWDRDVAPFVEAHCLACHAEGRIAGDLPFQTHDQAAPLASLLAAATAEGRMPPWGARATDWCPTPAPIRGDLTLTPDEVALLAAWAEAGAPEGDARAPLVPTPLETLPGANQSLSLPDREVLPDGDDDRTCFVLDPGLVEDGWLEGAAVEVTESAVVHHAGIRVVAADAGLEPWQIYPCEGGAGVPADYVGTYAPGSGPSLAPEGAAMHVPAGSLFVLNVHDHPLTDRTVTDRTTLHLRWADGPPEHVARLNHWPDPPELLLADVLEPGPNDTDGPELFIPAGVSGHTETVVGTLPGDPSEDVAIWQIASHMHRVGVEARIWAELPDGSVQCLLHVPHWDFDWQRMYQFEPGTWPVVPGGSRVFGQCTYDNTLANPGVVTSLAEQGLTEPVDVGYGEGTTDEMCMFMVGTL